MPVVLLLRGPPAVLLCLLALPLNALLLAKPETFHLGKWIKAV